VTMDRSFFLPDAPWSHGETHVTSVARAFGTARLCVLGLNKSEAQTVDAENTATLTAPQCAVQSDSVNSNGLQVVKSSVVSAGTCSSGGIVGADSITPAPNLDCPQIDDPLADRDPPTATGCDFLDFSVDKGETTLSPGTYCGGIKMANKAIVQ